jgi:hypothetical protein
VANGVAFGIESEVATRKKNGDGSRTNINEYKENTAAKNSILDLTKLPLEFNASKIIVLPL